MEVSIIIDVREPDRERIRLQLDKMEIPCSIERMEVGDFALVTQKRKGKGKEEEEEADSDNERRYVALVERKTFSDLDSSIIDKRYRDQYSRLLATKVPILMYLYTGGTNWADRFGARTQQHVMRVLSAQLHNVIKMGGAIKSVYAFNDDYLPHFLVKLREYAAMENYLTQTEADHVKLRTGISAKRYTERGKRRKLLSQPDVYREQLAVIHGLSSSVADQLVQRYSTMHALCEALKQQGEEKALKGITGAGKITRKKVYTALIEEERAEKSRK